VCLESSLEGVSAVNSSKFSWQCVPGEGPATEKARSANLVRVRGMTYELLADERRLERQFCRFAGQVPAGRLADMANMVMLCGRCGLWPIWLWPMWFVANMVVADMVTLLLQHGSISS